MRILMLLCGLALLVFSILGFTGTVPAFVALWGACGCLCALMLTAALDQRRCNGAYFRLDVALCIGLAVLLAVLIVLHFAGVLA